MYDDGKQLDEEENACYVVGACGFAIQHFKPKKGDYIIAADGGYKSLIKEKFEPDLVIGDFDSCDKNEVDHKMLLFPSKKDDTDTLLAVKEGLKKGYKTFYIFGALGGRLSHTLANIQTLRFLAENGCKGILIDEITRVFMLTDSDITFDEKQTGYISVFAFDHQPSEVTIHGLKYELDAEELTNAFPLGVSNEFIGKESRISVRHGSVIIVIEEMKI